MFLSASLPLQHINTPSLNLSALFDPSSLISLSVNLLQNDTLPSMPNLRHLHLAVTLIDELDLAPLCNSPLTKFSYSGRNLSAFIELVNCLPNIERAAFRASYSYDLSEYEDIISDTMRYLYFDISEASTNILINCSALEELYFIAVNTTFDVVAPNLQVLRLESWNLPTSFSSLGNLVDFSWRCFASTPRLIPSMLFAPNIRSFGLHSVQIANTNPNDIWKSLPHSISSLQLEQIILLYPGPMVIPSTWTSLKSLLITLSRFGLNAITDFSHLHSLQDLSISDGLNSPEKLYSFPNLQRLSIHGLPTFEFPPDFFVRMNKLTEVYVSNLAGTVPWYGLENLESLQLNGKFTSWPSIVGSASRLRRLTLQSSDLIMIPTDASFRAANLRNLVNLFISASSLTTAPVFWNNSSNLETVYINVKNNLDPLPNTIETPRLRDLRLVRTSFCGPLPDFAVPTHLDVLILRGNQFLGPIPQSWEDNLSIMRHLDLSLNYLNGTIPARLLDHHASSRMFIDLSDNDLTGPLWNMSYGVPDTLKLGFTGLDICLKDPDVRVEIPFTMCSMISVPKCPARCPALMDWCVASYSVCSEIAFSPRTQPLCNITSITCPLPQPGLGFECNHGTWIFLGDNSGETITLPPSGGPVIIFGNLSTNGTITFSGTGTSIEVQGCVLEAPPQIVIELPAGATPESATLITQRGKNCTTDLSQVPIVLVYSDEGCKKRFVVNSATPSSLTVIFTLDDQCPKASSSITKWIILGSSVGGIFVVLALIFAILLVKSPCFRTLMQSCNLNKALASK